MVSVARTGTGVLSLAPGTVCLVGNRAGSAGEDRGRIGPVAVKWIRARSWIGPVASVPTGRGRFTRDAGP